MRHLAPDMDPAVVAEIDRRLAGVATSEDVTIPWAIESGSRAWGFPSPDSDYDSRFLFVRRMEAYASPWRVRDVVETPLDAVVDVGGWDLAKAVRLAVRGNATVGEWLRSPLVYGGDEAFRDDLLDLVEQVTDRSALARHYHHLGLGQWERSGAAADRADTRLKGVFYALRPAATLHWLALHPTGPPPMNLQQLLAEASPGADVDDAVATLVELKSRTRELGTGRVPAPIRGFVEAMLQGAPPPPAGLEPDPRRRAVADACFLDLVRRFGPG